MFSVVAAIGLLLMVWFALTKRRNVLAVALLAAALAMLSAGAPLNNTGNFLWTCGARCGVRGWWLYGCMLGIGVGVLNVRADKYLTAWQQNRSGLPRRDV